MGNPFTREQVVQEIELMPDEYLGDIYRFLHFFRLGLKNHETQSRQPEQVLRFAGSWENWSDSEFFSFLDETRSRRRTAFKERRAE